MQRPIHLHVPQILGMPVLVGGLMTGCVATSSFANSTKTQHQAEQFYQAELARLEEKDYPGALENWDKAIAPRH